MSTAFLPGTRTALSWFDAIVIGAGPAGSAAALGLARAGLKALIVERGQVEGDRVGESLPPSVGPLLDRLGLREAFLATGPLACYCNRSVWGSRHVQEYDFLRDPHGHGWRVDRARFDAAILQAAVTAGAVFLGPTVLQSIEAVENHDWQLTLLEPGGTRQVTARVVVDASGRASAFVRRIGARRGASDYLVALTAFVQPAGAATLDTATLVEATPDGWWYSALLPDARLLAAFMTDPDLLRRGPSRSSNQDADIDAEDSAGPGPDSGHPGNGAVSGAAGWSAWLAMAPHTRDRVEQHGCQQTKPRVIAAGSALLDPVARSVAERNNDSCAGGAWLAVGDAAASFDPLASHGIGAALWSGERAAAAVRRHIDGDADALTDYAASIARSYEIYRSMQAALYGEERRWPNSPFWRRRHEAAAVASPTR